MWTCFPCGRTHFTHLQYWLKEEGLTDIPKNKGQCTPHIFGNKALKEKMHNTQQILPQCKRHQNHHLSIFFLLWGYPLSELRFVKSAVWRFLFLEATWPSRSVYCLDHNYLQHKCLDIDLTLKFPVFSQFQLATSFASFILYLKIISRRRLSWSCRP